MSSFPSIIRHPVGPVLIAENDENYRQFLEGVCQEMKLDYHSTGTGNEALQENSKKDYSIVLTELENADMAPVEYLDQLRDRHPQATFLIQSGIDSQEILENVLQKGVFDFLPKPLNSGLLRLRLENALEYRYLKKFELEQQQNIDIKLKSQMEWLNYKKAFRKTADEQNTLYSLKTSLSQGAGMGNAISLIHMLKESCRESGNDYLVDRDIADLLFENNIISQQMVQGLDSILDLMDREFTLSEIEVSRFIKELPDLLARVLPLFEKRGLKLQFENNQISNNLKIKIDQERIVVLLEELLINGYKYALPKSTLYFSTYMDKGYFCLCLRNLVKSEELGVPPDTERLVIEPFYRKRRVTDESVADVEKYGMGLGLTMIDFVIRKHNGLFFIQNSKEQASDEGGVNVISGVFFPLLDAVP